LSLRVKANRYAVAPFKIPVEFWILNYSLGIISTLPRCMRGAPLGRVCR